MGDGLLPSTQTFDGGRRQLHAAEHVHLRDVVQTSLLNDPFAIFDLQHLAALPDGQAVAGHA
jgi:hypothetical protein